MREEFVRDCMKGAPMMAAPINPSWIESGNPQARLAILAVSDDRAASTLLWECTAGKFTWRYNIDETIHFLDGEVTISVNGRPGRRYGAGDSLHFSRGAVATWEVETYIRKIAFCRSVLPRPFVHGRRFARAIFNRLRGRRDGLAQKPAFG
jgi:uncharacterized cupin superfamily protein